jgi:hypothetical protein
MGRRLLTKPSRRRCLTAVRTHFGTRFHAFLDFRLLWLGKTLGELLWDWGWPLLSALSIIVSGVFSRQRPFPTPVF